MLFDQTSIETILAGFTGVLVLALAYHAGKSAGKHDRRHWETDLMVEGKLSEP